MKNPIMTIELDNHEIIQIEMYPECANNTVRSMIDLIQKGKLNHRAIQRIAYDFVLQFTYNGFNHDPVCEYIIDGEFNVNNYSNPLKFKKGIVGMGGDGKSISSGCDFFITLSDTAAKRLDDHFCAFGKVIKGMDIVEKMTQVPTKKIQLEDAPGVDINEPITPIYMEKVMVETFGENYLPPVILRYGES